MPQLTMDHLRAFLADHEPPCISLYQATHRRFPDSRQDSIRFRNLVKEVEESLRRKYPTREVQPLLEPFLALVDNGHFWEHSQDGLAVLASPGTFETFRLQGPVRDLVVVADSFHTKPLLASPPVGRPLPGALRRPPAGQAPGGQSRRAR